MITYIPIASVGSEQIRIVDDISGEAVTLIDFALGRASLTDQARTLTVTGHSYTTYQAAYSVFGSDTIFSSLSTSYFHDIPAEPDVTVAPGEVVSIRLDYGSTYSDEAWWEGATAAWQFINRDSVEEAISDLTGNGHHLEFGALSERPSWHPDVGFTGLGFSNNMDLLTGSLTAVWCGRLASSNTINSLLFRSGNVTVLSDLCTGLQVREYVDGLIYASAGYTGSYQSTAAADYGQHHIIILQYDIPTQTQRLYLNGELKHTRSSMAQYQTTLFALGMGTAGKCSAAALYPTASIDAVALSETIRQCIMPTPGEDSWYYGATAAWDCMNARSSEKAKEDQAGGGFDLIFSPSWYPGWGFRSNARSGYLRLATGTATIFWIGHVGVSTAATAWCFSPAGADATAIGCQMQSYNEGSIYFGCTASAASRLIAAAEYPMLSVYTLCVDYTAKTQKLYINGIYKTANSNITPNTNPMVSIGTNVGERFTGAAFFPTYMTDDEVAAVTAKIHLAMRPEAPDSSKWYATAEAVWIPGKGTNAQNAGVDLSGNGHDLTFATEPKWSKDYGYGSHVTGKYQKLFEVGESVTAVWVGCLPCYSSDTSAMAFIPQGYSLGSVINGVSLMGYTDFRVYAQCSSTNGSGDIYRLKFVRNYLTKRTIYILKYTAGTGVFELWEDGVMSGTLVSPAPTVSTHSVTTTSTGKMLAAAFFRTADIDPVVLTAQIRADVYPNVQSVPENAWYYGSTYAYQLTGRTSEGAARAELNGTDHDLTITMDWNSKAGLYTTNTAGGKQPLIPLMEGNHDITQVWIGYVSHNLNSTANAYYDTVAVPTPFWLRSATVYQVNNGPNASQVVYKPNVPVIAGTPYMYKGFSVIVAKYSLSTGAWSVYINGTLAVSGTSPAAAVYGWVVSSHYMWDGSYSAIPGHFRLAGYAVFHDLNHDPVTLTETALSQINAFPTDVTDSSWRYGAELAYDMIWSDTNAFRVDHSGHGHDQLYNTFAGTFTRGSGFTVTTSGQTQGMDLLFDAWSTPHTVLISGITLAGTFNTTALTLTIYRYRITIAHTSAGVFNITITIPTTSGGTAATQQVYSWTGNTFTSFILQKNAGNSINLYINGVLLSPVTPTATTIPVYSYFCMYPVAGTLIKLLAIYPEILDAADLHTKVENHLANDPVVLANPYGLYSVSAYGETYNLYNANQFETDNTDYIFPVNHMGRADRILDTETSIQRNLDRFLTNLMGYLQHGRFDSEGRLILTGDTSTGQLTEGQDLGILSVSNFCPPYRFYVYDDATGKWRANPMLRLVEYDGAVHGDPDKWYVGLGGAWFYMPAGTIGKLSFLNILGPGIHYDIAFIMDAGTAGGMDLADLDTAMYDAVCALAPANVNYVRVPDYTTINQYNEMAFPAPGTNHDDAHRLIGEITLSGTGYGTQARWTLPFRVVLTRELTSATGMYPSVNYTNVGGTPIVRRMSLGSIWYGTRGNFSAGSASCSVKDGYAYGCEDQYFLCRYTNADNAVLFKHAHILNVGAGITGVYSAVAAITGDISSEVHMDPPSVYKIGSFANEVVNVISSTTAASLSTPMATLDSNANRYDYPDMSVHHAYSIPPICGFAPLSGTASMIGYFGLTFDPLRGTQVPHYSQVPFWTWHAYLTIPDNATNNEDISSLLTVAIFPNTMYSLQRHLQVQISVNNAGAAFTNLPDGAYQDYDLRIDPMDMLGQPTRYRFRVFKYTPPSGVTNSVSLGPFVPNLWRSLQSSSAATVSCSAPTTYMTYATSSNLGADTRSGFGLIPSCYLTMRIGNVGLTGYTDYTGLESSYSLVEGGVAPMTLLDPASLHKVYWYLSHTYGYTGWPVGTYPPGYFSLAGENYLDATYDRSLLMECSYDRYALYGEGSEMPDFIPLNEPVRLAGQHIIRLHLI